MICRLRGKLERAHEDSVEIEAAGLIYEVSVSASFAKELSGKIGSIAEVVIFYYIQMDQSRSTPVLIGFSNKLEKDFFEKFISVSGVGPRAALKALTVPIEQIASAIDSGDRAFLTKLPGIGDRRAREIIAKLEGKMGMFCLIRSGVAQAAPKNTDLRNEAVEVLLQLQYKKREAELMVDSALKSVKSIDTVEELLNAVYKTAHTAANGAL